MSSALGAAAKPTRALGDVLAMALDALIIMFTRGFSWREAVQQSWFIARVSLVPTLLVMLGFTLLVIVEVNLLLKDLGALDSADIRRQVREFREASVSTLLLNPLAGSAAERVAQVGGLAGIVGARTG